MLTDKIIQAIDVRADKHADVTDNQRLLIKTGLKMGMTDNPVEMLQAKRRYFQLAGKLTREQELQSDQIADMIAISMEIDGIYK